jgi:dihydroorotase
MADFDLVLKNLRVFEPDRWRSVDIGIRGKRIARLSPAGSLPIQSGNVHDLSDSYASPGWVDAHAHVVPVRHGGVGVQADRIGLASGVTALLDVGTVGAKNFHRLYENVIKKSQTPVFSFLNIKKSGLRFGKLGRGREAPDDDLDAMADVVEQYADRVRGIKITASKEHMLADDPLHYMRRSSEAGDRFALPVMVHIGRTPPSLEELLPLMKSGDIITHCFRNGDHTILDGEGRVREDVLEAKSRGIRFDVGHGVASFSFHVVEKALEQGFDDFIISSDLHILSRPFRARNFANVLSKFLAIGMKLEDVTERCSTRAAPLLGLERKIGEGRSATLTIFRLQKGRFRFRDCWGKIRSGTRRIVPVASLLDGKLFRT